MRPLESEWEGGMQEVTCNRSIMLLFTHYFPPSSLTLEVCDTKDISTSFASSANHFRSMNFRKEISVEILSKQFNNGALQTENGVVRGGLN